MRVKELWRYPVKSLRGEQLREAEVTENGIVGDRRVAVVSKATGRIITSRTKPRLLGLRGGIGAHGEPTVNGFRWDSEQAARLVREAAGPEATLQASPQEGVFDVLPLLIATDGAIEYLEIDSRRLRPNILVEGVPGLAERQWPGGTLSVGPVRIRVAKLRERCVMTTYDPDTLRQDLNVLRRIVSKLDGTMALDCAVQSPGRILLGTPVEFVPAPSRLHV